MFSSRQKEYALCMVTMDADNPQEFEALLMSIVQEIEKVSLSDKEKYSLLPMASVALYSFDYWYFNTDKWQKVLDTKTNTVSVFMPIDFSWGKFFAVDGVGALQG